MQQADDMPEKTEEQLAHDRLIRVQNQIFAKHCLMILCPYCGKANFKRKRTFCCDTLRKAVIAILSGQRALAIAAAEERAANN